MTHLRKAAAALAVLMLTTVPALADLTLLMVEQRGCAYCRMWDNEIAPIYPKTAEGKVAPLRRMDLNAAQPADVTLNSRPAFTPTFVLLRDGVEIDRLEGYPGEDFFWGLLARMLETEPEWAAHTGG
ncbi:thioredoxin family protein [Actibacterium ureilyticum]|uniref:thioredoxin family protein n=1 Tax=Actibacterium ureilyticum TaxID=1590614 RepID=UPI000BAAB8A6|nr:thioredoxin family protein [Actibacterium ureilyticum]